MPQKLYNAIIFGRGSVVKCNRITFNSADAILKKERKKKEEMVKEMKKGEKGRKKKEVREPMHCCPAKHQWVSLDTQLCLDKLYF